MDKCRILILSLQAWLGSKWMYLGSTTYTFGLFRSEGGVPATQKYFNTPQVRSHERYAFKSYLDYKNVFSLYWICKQVFSVFKMYQNF